MLQRDATLVFGQNVTRELSLPAPDKDVARYIFEPVLMLARYASGLEANNNTDFEFPADPSRKLRKLARLAVLGGACLLMAQGRFASYKGTDVIPLLHADYPEWTQFLERTTSLYIALTSTTPAEIHPYSLELVAWLEWINDQLI